MRDELAIDASESSRKRLEMIRCACHLAAAKR